MKMNKFKKVTIFSLIITLPIVLFFITIISKSIVLKMDSYKFGWYTPNKLNISKILTLEYINLKNQVLYSFGLTKRSDINILINSAKKNELLSDLPKTAFKDKKALLIINKNAYKGKTRLRGDTFYHWFYPQSSWRFKLSKNNLISGVRKLNYITPKSNLLINNHISYLLANKIGLLSPRSSMHTVSINGIFNGTKMQVEQIDENFLRNNRRMPNDIYKGDNIASNAVRGIGSMIFNTASIWDKASYNNHYDKENVYPLSNLLAEISKNEYSLYDLNNFSKFAMYIDITGSTHHDILHNWILYYDNYYEKFYPIVWDTVGFTSFNDNINLITSPLLSSLYKNYDFIKFKYHNFKDFTIKDKSKFMDEVTHEKNNIKAILNDTNIGTFNASRNYKTPKNLKKQLDLFPHKIENKINKIENKFLGKVNISDYSYSIQNNILRLSIKGNKLITKININTTQKKNINKIFISYLLNGKKLKKNINFFSKDNNISIPIELISNAKIIKDAKKIKIFHSQKEKLVFEEATYDLELEGLDVNDIKNIKFEFLNLENQIISVNKVPHIEQKTFQNVNHIVKEYVDNTPIIWSGTKNFSGFNAIKENIIIEPGTKIIFDENATIKVLGKVAAIGTKEDPIIFEAKDKTKPWNAFALKDAKANGSVFKYCIFRDGSGDKGDLYEYTAMFSVHNVKDLLVEDCEFYDSHRTDDMVHVIYSDVIFKNTKFIRSLSDALDIDISNALIDNCEFIDSGNDAIDLMTTNAIVTNTKFTNSLDKAISIGEGSNLLAINNYIEGSEIGMQSKDTSQAYIYNSSFISNKKAIDAYHKNWRYSEGGTIVLDNCVFKDNIINATVGKKSKVVINSSDIDTPNKFDIKSLKKKKIIISDNGFIKYDLKEPLFKDKTHLIDKKKRGYYE